LNFNLESGRAGSRIATIEKLGNRDGGLEQAVYGVCRSDSPTSDCQSRRGAAVEAVLIQASSTPTPRTTVFPLSPISRQLYLTRSRCQFSIVFQSSNSTLLAKSSFQNDKFQTTQIHYEPVGTKKNTIVQWKHTVGGGDVIYSVLKGSRNDYMVRCGS
jgi:hypothetical protein